MRTDLPWLDPERTAALHEAARERILVLDGAMGTSLQDAGLSAEDFGGADLEGCNENLVLTRPELLRRQHATFLEAGADVVETDTFGGTSPSTASRTGPTRSTQAPRDWRARRWRATRPRRGRDSWPGRWGPPPRPSP
jgi:hypothetical protein